jgi:hypothetical protein
VVLDQAVCGRACSSLPHHPNPTHTPTPPPSTPPIPPHPHAPTHRANGSQHTFEDRHQLSDAEMLDRSRRLTEAGLPEAMCKAEGCHGCSVFNLMLPYNSPSALFPVGVSHVLLRGVVRGFLLHIIRTLPTGQPNPPPDCLSRAARRIIQQRAVHIRVPHDFGRPYTCVIQCVRWCCCWLCDHLTGLHAGLFALRCATCTGVGGKKGRGERRREICGAQ